MSSLGVVVADERGSILFNHSIGSADVKVYVKVDDNDRRAYGIDTDKQNRALVVVAEDGEEFEIAVTDYMAPDVISYNAGADKTYFYESATKYLDLYHVDTPVLLLDSNGEIVAEGVIDNPGALSRAVFEGDVHGFGTIVGVRQTVAGRRGVLSCGIGMPYVSVQQMSGDREYEFYVLEEVS